MTEGTSPAPLVQVRSAATVVLLRDAAEAHDGSRLEAYLVRRVPTMAFAAGMHVFPGGSVDPGDDDVAWDVPQEWPSQLAADVGLARALGAAAVRETFEESGVLLAGSSSGTVVGATDGAAWEADRLALLDGSLTLAGLLAHRRLVLRADLLRPWAHWITPTGLPRRFDTRFFVAALPEGQRTRDVGGEADAVVWARPHDVLDGHDAGTVTLMPPTAATLAELADLPDVAAVLRAAQGRVVETVLPDSAAHAVSEQDRAAGLRGCR